MLSNGRFIKIYIQKKNILSRVVTIGYNQSCSQTSHKQLIENTKTHRRFFCGFKFSLKKEIDTEFNRMRRVERDKP